MKKNLILILITLVALASCKTREKVVYLQDLNDSTTVPTQPIVTLKLQPGDKLGVVVTSAATPELATRYNLTTGTNSSTSSANYDNFRYSVDENGDIDMLGIGRIHVGGLTRSEAAAKIQQGFRAGLLKDAVVTVSTYNQYVTILGVAGDLNITGRRDAVKVIRQEGDVSKTYFIDLRSKDVFNSPVYNLQQNDIVYVEPNKVKMGQSTNNDNSVRAISTWLSVTSVLTSIAILIWR